MARLVRRINRRVTFTGVTEPIPRQRAINALKEADIIVGSVDSYHARGDIQDLAWAPDGSRLILLMSEPEPDEERTRREERAPLGRSVRPRLVP